MARRQHRQNVANAMLAAAAGLLTPSPTRYQLGPLQRLGAGLGAALQSYNDGAGQERILDALAMDGGGVPARISGRSARPQRMMSAPAATQLAAAQSAVSGRRTAAVRRRMGGANEMARKHGSARAALHKFDGTLASRLDHPAVLPGGWKLYGYAKDSGSPVYVGPDAELRIYD